MTIVGLLHGPQLLVVVLLESARSESEGCREDWGREIDFRRDQIVVNCRIAGQVPGHRRLSRNLLADAAVVVVSKKVVSFMKKHPCPWCKAPGSGNLHIEVQTPVAIDSEGTQTALDDRHHGEEHGSHVWLNLYGFHSHGLKQAQLLALKDRNRRHRCYPIRDSWNSSLK